MVGMAHSLNMRVVVEGIETPHQLAEVEALGCDLGQGYIFSRPVDPKIAGELLLDDQGTAVWEKTLRQVLASPTSLHP